ncbi:hypothetical protein QJS10_CPA01g00723 [Acorus calamus]|uniref:Uncharacterized protein n=1 Tax=Acorus calamus TaxID=4465 RepID=A0AAV9FLA6_ACOCL|nr:hypothetical protein QJS10_CPA01g00723 [Acorus calamus]
MSYNFEKSPGHDAYVPRLEVELVMDLDRKVKCGRERLAQELEVTPPLPIPTLLVLEEKIKKLLEQVETLGEASKVDEAEALMRKVLMGFLSRIQMYDTTTGHL